MYIYILHLFAWALTWNSLNICLLFIVILLVKIKNQIIMAIFGVLYLFIGLNIVILYIWFQKPSGTDVRILVYYYLVTKKSTRVPTIATVNVNVISLLYVVHSSSFHYCAITSVNIICASKCHSIIVSYCIYYTFLHSCWSWTRAFYPSFILPSKHEFASLERVEGPTELLLQIWFLEPLELSRWWYIRFDWEIVVAAAVPCWQLEKGEQGCVGLGSVYLWANHKD